MSSWLAVISDCNPLFNMGKACRQKDSCSYQQDGCEQPISALESNIVNDQLMSHSKGKVTKVQNVKSSLQLVDEPDEEHAQPEPKPEPQGANEEYDVLMEEDQAKLDPRQSHVALAGPNPEPTHDKFIATVYPQVHESLKHTTEEHFQMENPLSSIRTLSSMKNLDNFNFELAARVTTLEKKFSDFEQKSQTLDNATQNLGSRVFTLELWDLHHKINQTVNEVVKEPLKHRWNGKTRMNSLPKKTSLERDVVAIKILFLLHQIQI
nr:hypothetical protein [Tanacetum cinerariifolium]